MTSPLNKKLEHVKWGEFKLGDLFDIRTTSGFDSNNLTDGDEYDYVTRTSCNQGILRKTGFVNQSNINEAGGWSLGLLQMDFFYRNRPWYAGQFVRNIVPKIKLTEPSILFFTTVLNKLKPKLLSVLVRHVDKLFCNSRVLLPITTDHKIDFEFINSFVAELEAERVAELEAYLTVTGLKDYELTEKETLVLKNFNNINFSIHKLDDLFTIQGTKSLDSNAVDFVKEGVNFVGRTFDNNGIQGKILKRDFLPNEANTITATVIGNYKYVKYQTEEYYCSQNINKLTPKIIFRKWNKEIAYFLVTHIQKFVSLYDGQQGGYKLNDIKNHVIFLPTNNSQIDFDTMETLISAVKKLLIKDVVEYANNKIKATKQAIAH